MEKGLIFLLFLASCSAPMMTPSCYHTVQMGESVEILEERCGKAYHIREMENGFIEYHYIERIGGNTAYSDQNDYYIIVKDGRVVQKRQG